MLVNTAFSFLFPHLRTALLGRVQRNSGSLAGGINLFLALAVLLSMFCPGATAVEAGERGQLSAQSVTLLASASDSDALPPPAPDPVPAPAAEPASSSGAVPPAAPASSSGAVPTAEPASSSGAVPTAAPASHAVPSRASSPNRLARPARNSGTVKSENLPPEAPDYQHGGGGQAQYLPQPASEPQGEMPPTAPPIGRRNDPSGTGVGSVPGSASGSGSTSASGSGSGSGPGSGSGSTSGSGSGSFNLRAQRNVLNEQQDGMLQPPLDGRYGEPGNQRGSTRLDRVNGGVDVSDSGSRRSLTRVELQKLADHDVVLLIDSSGSMGMMDCPSGSAPGKRGLGMLPALLGVPFMSTSRWNWCLQQTSEMSRQTQGIYERGITIVLYSTGFRVFQNVTLDRLPQIFSQNFPFGTTNLAQPLALQIGEYFRRRTISRGSVKPLIVGIITDGCPTNRRAVVDAIIEATQMMSNAQEVTIIFFLIGGMDFAGERFVHDLSTNLLSKGARFPIVKEVLFSEMQDIGLAKAIAQNLQ
jgi:hypothetical protein